jgi:hypothetical protein
MMADILDKDLVGIVGSIFATSPEAMKIARERADLTRAQAIANAEAQQMGGGSALNANLMGGQAVRQLGGLLGVQDPMMQRESAKRQLATGLDMSSPEAVMEYANRLNNAGLSQEAGQAVVAARAMQQQMATISKTKAEEQAKLREPLPNIAKLQAYRAKAAESGATPEQLAQIDAVITAEGAGKGSKTEVNIGGLDKVFSEAFSKAEGKDQAAAWAKAGDAYSDSAKLSRNVREMEDVVGSAFVGSYGSLKAGVSRAFGGGKRLEDTEVLDALSAQLVLPLAKLLPGSLAVKELDQLIKTKPNLAQQEGTIRRLLSQIKQDLQASELTYEAGERYRKENKGSIIGFNPNIANNRATRYVELQNKYNSGKPLTEAEKREAKAIADELKIQQ